MGVTAGDWESCAGTEQDGPVPGGGDKAANNNRYRTEDLGNGVTLDSRLDDCTSELPGGNSDSDFNDSYMQFLITGTGVPTDISTVPEPVSMSLLAIGLVGMGGASLRRRRSK
jgi:hypothetical protein